MGYMIQYNPDSNKKYPAKISLQCRKYGCRAVIALLLIVLSLLAFKYRDVLLQWILPGDGAVTAAALKDLVADFRDGAPVGEAVTAFCKEIIDHAAR